MINTGESSSDDEYEVEEKTLEEKFLVAGYGVKAFFDITSLIMKMFLFITIVFTPVMYLYS